MMRNTFRQMTIVALWLGLMASFGCNSAFYHPDDIEKTFPDSFPYHINEAYVSVADGALLRVWHIVPEAQAQGLILFFHGNSGNITGQLPMVRWLVDSGFHVVLFDYRGFGKSKGEPSRRGLVEDARAMLAWVAHDETLSQLDLFVYGQSLGGAVALPAVVLDSPAQLRAIVVEGSFGSYRKIARAMVQRSKYSWIWSWMGFHWLVSDELSPRDFVAKLNKPLLVVLGEADTTVPVNQGRELFDKAQASQRELWIIPNQAHLQTFRKTDEFRGRLIDYFCRHGSRVRSCLATTDRFGARK